MINGATAFIANMMTASVTAVDLATEAVVKTFSVDPGPHSLAVNAAKNQLLVLAERTGTLDLVDLNSYKVTSRVNAGDSERQGSWVLPLGTAITPKTASAGSSCLLKITGTNLRSVKDIEFHMAGYGSGMGGGMMGGGPGQGVASEEANIRVSNVQANADGTQLMAYSIFTVTSAAVVVPAP